MQQLLTLLTPSAALPGLLSRAYTAESQLARFERLRRHPGSSLTGTDSAFSAAEAHFRAQASGALALLDNLEISDTPPIGTFKAALDSFGITLNSPGKSEFWKVVEASARAGAVRRWDARLQIEAYEATRRQWFLVFDTITYDPSQFSDDVMFGQYWRRYQRSVQHSVVRRAYGSLRRFRLSGRSFTDHVRYFAVPEAHKDGRTHVHILWFLSDLPDVASEADPNGHSPITPRRQVDGWPPYPYGLITMRLPCSLSGRCVYWSAWLASYRLTKIVGNALCLGRAVAVARYVAKYLVET